MTVMKAIYSRILLVLACVSAPVALSAKDADSLMSYRRSSLYSMMISHPEQEMDNEIVGAFMSLETPDKYNNHDLSVKCITTDSRKDDARMEVEDFLRRNMVAKKQGDRRFRTGARSGERAL